VGVELLELSRPTRRHASSLESRWLLHMLGLAVVTVPIVGFFVYWPFAALADRIAPAEDRSVHRTD
jgi:hypothetical protein